MTHFRFKPGNLPIKPEVARFGQKFAQTKAHSQIFDEYIIHIFSVSNIGFMADYTI